MVYYMQYYFFFLKQKTSSNKKECAWCSDVSSPDPVGCGISAPDPPAEFAQPIAIAKGTPANPLVEPEDLLDAKIVGCTPQAESLGIRPGITGREAVELMLAAERNSPA